MQCCFQYYIISYYIMLCYVMLYYVILDRVITAFNCICWVGKKFALHNSIIMLHNIIPNPGPLNQVFNSIAPEICGSNIESTIFKHIIKNNSLSTVKLLLSDWHRTSPMKGQHWFRRIQIYTVPITKICTDFYREAHLPDYIIMFPVRPLYM